MKSLLKSFILLTVIGLTIACEQFGTDRNRYKTNVYYVSPSGDDMNPGTAGKTLDVG